jgi:hypothetical protein
MNLGSEIAVGNLPAESACASGRPGSHKSRQALMMSEVFPGRQGSTECRLRLQLDESGVSPAINFFHGKTRFRQSEFAAFSREWSKPARRIPSPRGAAWPEKTA